MTVLRIVELTHAELAVLGREFLMAGHLIDRASMPHVIGAYGRDEMVDIAVEEWMGASPVYTRRMQRALDMVGDDVESMFKGMQLDIGAPPEFMDFCYRVNGSDEGEFWLRHCGALMDVEPMGEEYVHAMCHNIEDPTFEATACASNPRARVTPLHRPPRVPADRLPHCHWSVVIDRDAEPLAEPAAALAVAARHAASCRVEAFGADDDGWSGYARPLDPDMRLEDFSTRALSLIAQEAALQGHLLVLAFLAAVTRRHGGDVAAALGGHQLAGAGGVTAARLRRAFALDATPVGMAGMFELHPAFHPRGYVDWAVSLDGDRVVLELGECPALDEGESWATLLIRDDTALGVMARAVAPSAVVHRREAVAGAGAWEVTLGDAAAPEHPDVALTRMSGGAAFDFHRTGPRVATPVPSVGMHDTTTDPSGD